MKSSLVLKFAENEKYSGASAFAAQNSRFPCAAFLATSDFAKQPAMAVLWGTFDDLRVPPNDAPNISCISQFTERYWNKRHLVETHPFNWTCVTNGNCEPDEIFYGYTAKSLNAAVERRDPVLLEKIRNRYKEIRESAGYWRNSNTYIVATAGLEDHWTDKAFAIVVSEGAKEWPFFLVRSGSAFGTWPREVHGKDAKCSGSTIFTNEDGYVSSNAQSGKWLKRNQNCMIRVIWRAAHQGRDPRTNAFGGPPRKRVFTWTAQDVIGEGNLLRLY